MNNQAIENSFSLRRSAVFKILIAYVYDSNEYMWMSWF